MESLWLYSTMGEEIEVTGKTIFIRKKGKETTIPISSIQEVVLKEPTKLRPGGDLFIYTAKGASGYISTGFGLAGVGGEIRIGFKANSLPAAKRIRDYILNYETILANAGTEELIKYKKLLDAGAITHTEYDRKKKEILGL